MTIEELKTFAASWRTRAEVIVLVIFSVTVWYLSVPAPATVNEWHPATSAPQVVRVPKEIVKFKYLVVYKESAKKALNLPAEIKNDPAQHVVDSTVVPSDQHAQTVTTVADEKTGEVKTVVRIEPLPWLAAEQHGAIGIGYGITSGMLRGWSLNAHEDLLQVKALHLGVDGALLTGGAYFAGLGLAYHW